MTDRAAARLIDMARAGGMMPRIEISAGGCNGFNKKFSLDLRHNDDMTIDIGQGVCILLDPLSYDMLSNSTVDYHNDLQGNYFSIHIPEAVSTCGCGSSFSV